MDFSLLQKHTTEIYNLRNHKCKIEQVPARSLLKPQRFDLFAKLYYICNASKNKDSALKVYSEHIKSFNPDGSEPGRDDKNGINDFVSAFDQIIEHFRDNEFDNSISLVPVDKHGVILDGAHRVAALAYYGKSVTIARYDDVDAKCAFDYLYFKNRGLPWEIADAITLEMVKWTDNLLVACLWPSTDETQKRHIIDAIRKQHLIAYRKDFRCDLHSLANFVGHIYREQEWTQNPDYVLDKASRVFGKSSLSIVFFESQFSLDAILAEKDCIRKKLGRGKDSLHISDNHVETIDIATITLNEHGQKEWMTSSSLNFVNKCLNNLRERWLIFRKVKWIAFKVSVYKLIKGIR